MYLRPLAACIRKLRRRESNQSPSRQGQAQEFGLLTSFIIGFLNGWIKMFKYIYRRDTMQCKLYDHFALRLRLFKSVFDDFLLEHCIALWTSLFSSWILILRGSTGFYLEPCTLTQWGMLVAHEAKVLFPILGFDYWTGHWTALGKKGGRER